MMGGAKAHYDGIVAFSQTDFTEDLKKITVPVLVMHGDDDQIVPYADSAPLSAKLLKNGTLRRAAASLALRDLFVNRNEVRAGAVQRHPASKSGQFGSLPELTHRSLIPRSVDPEPLHLGH
jgi:dienelactone hydrolase